MFWRRRGPAGAAHRLAATRGKPNWPRNGAVLRGFSHGLGQDSWLEVMEYSAQGPDGPWQETPNCWMPFYQGGLLLHPA